MLGSLYHGDIMLSRILYTATGTQGSVSSVRCAEASEVSKSQGMEPT